VTVIHQMGHDSENLLFEPELGSLRGAVLSPVNYDRERVLAQIQAHKESDFQFVFDPQFYVPNSDRGSLQTWSYFPTDVDTADLSSLPWWSTVVDNYVDVLGQLNPAAACSPAVIPRVFSDAYYALTRSVADSLSIGLSGSQIAPMLTAIIETKSLTENGRAQTIASILTSGKPCDIYLVLMTDVDPRRELSDAIEIRSVMHLIQLLSGAGCKVFVAFAGLEFLLWRYAGAHTVATGKFLNLRRFSPARFEEAKKGGGALPYWFEDRLFALLREPDVIRVRDSIGLSDAAAKNPFSQKALKCIASNQPWMGLSWRQFLWACADLDARFSSGALDLKAFLRDASKLWDDIDEKDVVMDEIPNTGSWIQKWRQALGDFSNNRF